MISEAAFQTAQEGDRIIDKDGDDWLILNSLPQERPPQILVMTGSGGYRTWVKHFRGKITDMQGRVMEYFEGEEVRIEKAP